MSSITHQNEAPGAGIAEPVDVVYLDHNAVVGMTGLPRWADADAERARVFELRDRGIQVAMSAWHIYELARSEDADNVRQCCEFVEQLNPVWANNPTSIKRQELQRFLASLDGAQAGELPLVHPFSRGVSEMWGTYGAPIIIGETFRNAIRELKVAPGALKIAERAAAATPSAIGTAREANADGRIDQVQPAIDRGYFEHLLRCGINDPRLDLLLSKLKEVYRACPAIAVESRITKVRARDSFVPGPGDAPDLQHAVVALAYGSAFITDDKRLFENCRVTLKQLGRSVQLHKRVCNVVLADANA